jgi:uncharacterized protein YuzE
MNEPYLEITFRRGRMLAAYLYLPRSAGETCARSRAESAGLVVDYSQTGKPIGIEIVSPALARLADVNTLLAELGAEPLSEVEWAPLAAA